MGWLFWVLLAAGVAGCFVAGMAIGKLLERDRWF